MGVPMWNFSVPYKLKQLIDLTCQRNMLFTFDGAFYGPSLSIDKAFVAYVRGQSDEAGFKTVSQPGFEYLGYVEFWLRFIGVRSVLSLTVEHTWDGRALDMIEAGKRQAVGLAGNFDCYTVPQRKSAETRMEGKIRLSGRDHRHHRFCRQRGGDVLQYRLAE